MNQSARIPPIREADWQRQVTKLAELLGWDWVHFRPGMNRRGQWQTPTRGPLGVGWPDLFLVRERDGRHMVIELKAEGKRPTPDQLVVLARLERAGLEVHIAWPTQLEEVMGWLR